MADWIASLSVGSSAEFALDGLVPLKVYKGFYFRTSFDLPLPVEAIDVG